MINLTIRHGKSDSVNEKLSLYKLREGNPRKNYRLFYHLVESELLSTRFKIAFWYISAFKLRSDCQKVSKCLVTLAWHQLVRSRWCHVEINCCCSHKVC